jgi:hypothetical protein
LIIKLKWVNEAEVDLLMKIMEIKTEKDRHLARILMQKDKDYLMNGINNVLKKTKSLIKKLNFKEKTQIKTVKSLHQSKWV